MTRKTNARPRAAGNTNHLPLSQTRAERRAQRWATAQLKRIPRRRELPAEQLEAILEAPGLRVEPKRRSNLINAIEKAAWWYSFRTVSHQNPKRKLEIERANGISNALTQAIRNAETPTTGSGPESTSDYKLSNQVAGWLAHRAAADDTNEEAYSVAFERACKAFDEMRWVQAEMDAWARDLKKRDAPSSGFKPHSVTPPRRSPCELIRT